jgi:putative transposase
MNGLQFFDRQQDFTVAWRTLPHWSQAGTVCFLTWRTNDSLPKSLLEQLDRERAAIFQEFGLEATADAPLAILGENRLRRQVSPKLAKQLAKLSPRDNARLKWRLFTAWDNYLAHGAGECLLARPELAAIVAESLRHFDGDRYVLTDYVVMPNHVHVLAAFADEDALLTQTTSWKRFTARQIHQALGRQGEFWQVEQFDHLVRSLEQFEYLRKYVAENPKQAGLAPGSYRHYSKPLM